MPSCAQSEKYKPPSKVIKGPAATEQEPRNRTKDENKIHTVLYGKENYLEITHTEKKQSVLKRIKIA